MVASGLSSVASVSTTRAVGAFTITTGIVRDRTAATTKNSSGALGDNIKSSHSSSVMNRNGSGAGAAAADREPSSSSSMAPRASGALTLNLPNSHRHNNNDETFNGDTTAAAVGGSVVPSAPGVAMPGLPSPASTSSSTILPTKSDDNNKGHKVDRFGFIQNMDANGNLLDQDYDDDGGVIGAGKSSPLQPNGGGVLRSSGLPPYAEIQRTARRERKWEKLIQQYYDKGRQPPRQLLLKRTRKGIPHSLRGKVWGLFGNVPAQVAAHPGLYDSLVRQTVEPPPKPPRSVHQPCSSSQSLDLSKDERFNHTKSFRNLQDTIERDIHRTFPRHSLFYEENHSDSSSDVGGERMGLCGTAEISSMIRELELGQQQSTNGAGGRAMDAHGVLSAQGGQASLRRVLKAYSLYDREIGYCQGMNFIAGMFLTLMTEEEAFWLLVAVMSKPPCKMRGLFGEGMRETHQVLFVAERLIHLFLPRLSKHLEREHIHITMFATQWLLTQYTSSFRFDLVMRVWDCFLNEGWKITYRVMLALLQQWQSELLKMSFEDILAFFRELPDRMEGAAVLELAIKVPLRRKHIAKYEREWQVQQQQ